MNEGILHIGKDIQEGILKNIDKTLTSSLSNGELSTISYNVTKQTPIELSFENETIYIKNNDCFGCIEVNINSSETNYILNPKSTIKVMNANSVILTAVLVQCEVSIIKGIDIEIENNEPDVVINNYMPDKYRCLSCSVDNVLFGQGKYIYISNDGGHTIASTYNTNINTSIDYIETGKISTTDKNKMIVFTNQGQIFLTTDGGINWINPDLSSITDNVRVLPPFYNACVWIGNNIIFGEYGTITNRPYRIFKSNDNGATWSIALSKNNISDIRHWHSIDHLHYSNKLIITSGDENVNIKWFLADTAGNTFNEIEGVNSQVYRALRIVEQAPNVIMWGSDSNYSPWGIFKANLSDIINTTEMVTDCNNTVFGFHKAGERIIATTCCAAEAYQDGQATIYLSKDNGKTFKRVLETQAMPLGFTSCVGVNKYGEFALTTNKIAGALNTYHTFMGIN